MILVTGATGQFGKAAINALLEKGIKAHQILALVRNEQSAEDLKNMGVGIVMGDYDQYTSLVSAFKGVDKLLFVSGSDIIKRHKQHQNVIHAAQEAGVKHLIYTSFQRKNETETSPLWIVAQSHIQTEQWIKESNISYTILRNNLYMDFLPGFIGEKVLQTGVIYVPAENGKVSAVLRSEMAEAAATILATTGHEGKEYNFTNTEAVSYQEIAQLITEVSGKVINYISPSVEEYMKTLSDYGVPADVIGIFSSFALAQAKGELDRVSTDLEVLLGRKPSSVKDFLSSLYNPIV
ncbi:SDR family oxidoreductase [Pedobacter aquae]|uniref:SDR family oxidoreductase n=1 Tax=Pedobacter aquae TaxID=2605747 RepID=A0A5C0VFM2_9SPHI|nr:SDR family oxidoreductase [Pedobacter aquae]QEK50673.1 SDR family oxidoreductase [Pedobacter aquae]